MRFIEDLCPPALLYLIFLVIQLGLDLSLGLWVTFTIKVLFGILVTLLLDTFCGIGLTPVSWFIVAVPFLITAIATAVSMGTQFDLIVLQQVGAKETFKQKDDDEEDLNVPKSSNAAERQASS
jgi:hypothetical protein